MIDFPKISFTASRDNFNKLSKYGKELVELNLLIQIPNKILTAYPAKGSDIVHRVMFDQDKKRFYINEKLYFSNIKKEIWQYRIGSYQGVEKMVRRQNQPSIIH
jgi:hypothetical protein